MTLLSCVLLLNVLMSPGQAAAADVVAPRYAALTAALQKGDFVAVSEMYHPDASFELKTPGGMDRVRGHESIAAQWQGVARAGAAQFRCTVSAADIKDGTVTEKGTFVFNTKAGALFGKGSYTGTWRKDGNVWKLLRHEVMVDAAGR